MPLIPSQLLNCAFFLYKNRDDALAGKGAGGTGFLIAAPSPDGLGHHYGVSNHHVAVSGLYSCIRLNAVSGPVVLEFGPEEWIFEPGKDDVAIIPLDIRQPGMLVTFVGTNLLLFPQAADEEKIGPGDDVFMVGRFVDIDATQTNVIAVRSGTISTVPVPIVQPNGYNGPCYCVDMHSRTGYSGSPVFVYRTPGNTLEWALSGGPVALNKSLLALLGIHCGQFTEELPVRKKRKPLSAEAPLSEKAYDEYIEGLSGMTCVIPAWRIRALLERPELVEHQRRVAALRKENR